MNNPDRRAERYHRGSAQRLDQPRAVSSTKTLKKPALSPTGTSLAQAFSRAELDAVRSGCNRFGVGPGEAAVQVFYLEGCDQRHTIPDDDHGITCERTAWEGHCSAFSMIITERALVGRADPPAWSVMVPTILNVSDREFSASLGGREVFADQSISWSSPGFESAKGQGTLLFNLYRAVPELTPGRNTVDRFRERGLPRRAACPTLAVGPCHRRVIRVEVDPRGFLYFETLRRAPRGVGVFAVGGAR